MAATVPDQVPGALPGGEPGLRRCIRCNLTYLPAKSTSALRLTYCSFLCELGHLGFSISGLEHMERASPAAPEAAADEAQDQERSKSVRSS